MPELPEVETIKRSLAEKVTGRHITDIQVLLGRVIKWPAEIAVFKARLLGKNIDKVVRKGKYLILELEDDTSLVIHLRMTGRLIYANDGNSMDRFTRVVFILDNEVYLYYSDIRTLGTIYAVKGEDELARIHGLKVLGPEPLTEAFSVNYLQQTLNKKKGKIKALLLNQELIGGLGNIYADESLALAEIHPERPANSLTFEEIVHLYEAVNSVIAQAIADGGTTFRDYLNGEGKKGSHQDKLLVYGRKGLPCRKCGTPIMKIEVAGRGTCFCPQCQH